jgi:hypothetical protein
VADGSVTVSPPSETAPAGGGTSSFLSLDGSGLADGALTLTAVARDVNLNQSPLIGSGAKDTVVPALPSGAVVAAGTDNPQDYINILTVTAVVVDVTWTGGVNANDRCTATLQGGIQVTSGEILPSAGAGTTSSAAFDATGLTEGSILLSLNVYDLAGNTDGVGGTTATLDLTPPATPVVDPVTSPTNGSSQTITGVATGGGRVEVSGGIGTATTTTPPEGHFTVEVDLAGGATNTLSVVSMDPAGNPGSPVTVDWNSTALVIVQDGAAPSIPFTDVTFAAGVSSSGFVAGGTFADVDGDGDLDLLVGGAGLLYLGDGAGGFVDVTLTLGVSLAADRSATFADYDNDGDLDLLLTDSNVGATLYRNDLIGSGVLGFTDVTVSAGAAVGTDLRGGGWFDLEQDGFIDILIADNDGSGNHLLANGGAGTFSATMGTGLTPPTSSDPSWVGFGDLNGDGLLDVVMGDQSPSHLWWDDTSGPFKEQAGPASGFDATMESSQGGFVLLDIDNDGDLDIFVCRGGSGNENQLWRNSFGFFTEVATAASISVDVGAYDCVAGDFNNDGLVDLYLACDGNNVLYLNQGDQIGGDGIPEFIDVSAQAGGLVNDAGNGRLALAGDIDGDGDLDIYTGNLNQPAVLFRNNLDNFSYLKVDVRGKGGSLGGSSLDAIGTVVEVTDEITSIVIASRLVTGARGAGAQDPAILHFGGIVPSRPYVVTARFPTGVVESMSSVYPVMLSGQTVTIIEQ